MALKSRGYQNLLRLEQEVDKAEEAYFTTNFAEAAWERLIRQVKTFLSACHLESKALAKEKDALAASQARYLTAYWTSRIRTHQAMRDLYGNLPGNEPGEMAEGEGEPMNRWQAEVGALLDSLHHQTTSFCDLTANQAKALANIGFKSAENMVGNSCNMVNFLMSAQRSGTLRFSGTTGRVKYVWRQPRAKLSPRSPKVPVSPQN